MYIKTFEIRWNDLDANGHLGNSSYVEFMSHTRMSFFTDYSFDLDYMNANNLGPIVIYEHIYYYKEFLTNDTVYVSLEVSGMTEDAQFVLITHNFYNGQGRHMAHAEMLFSFIDLESRKLGRVTSETAQRIKSFPYQDNCRTLTKDDIRKYGKRPEDIDAKALS